MGQITGLAMTMLWLVALYLILINFSGTTAILNSFGGQWITALRTLQGRD